MSEPFVKDQAHRERIEKGEAILPSYPVTEPALDMCPLCKSKAIFLERDFPPIGLRYGVACRECDCRCDYRKTTKEEAAAQWNWRSGTHAQTAVDTVTAKQFWEALKERCGSTPDKSKIKALVMVRFEDVVAALASPVSSTPRHGPCQCCGETKDLKCGPSRFGAETWACADCWEPDGAAVSSTQEKTP